MRFTVVWSPDAQDQLTNVWLKAADRGAVTRAAHQVDGLLGNDPFGNGIEFYGDRLLVAQPLQLIYSVRIDDRIVEILQVW